MKKHSCAKLIEGDVSAAVHVVASDDTIIYPTVIDAFRLEHPTNPSDFRPSFSFHHPPTSNQNDVLAALRSFSPSSSAGLDGLKLEHLKDLTSSITFEAGRKLLNSLSNMFNILLSGNAPIYYARDLIFAANLTVLRKKDGGIRPIAVGYVFRRLASKIIFRMVVNDLGNELRPIKLGVGVRNGCEGAVHSIRDYISANQNNTFPKSILIELHMKNAFKAVCRDHLLEVCPTVPFLFTT